jgi:hypothetical protein
LHVTSGKNVYKLYRNFGPVSQIPVLHRANFYREGWRECVEEGVGGGGEDRERERERESERERVRMNEGKEEADS